MQSPLYDATINATIKLIVALFSCLLYNFTIKREGVIMGIKEKYNLIPVCPEIMGGMPTPRNPIEIKDGKVFDYDGEEFTKEFEKGSEEVLKLAKLYNSSIAILKENSLSLINKECR